MPGRYFQFVCLSVCIAFGDSKGSNGLKELNFIHNIIIVVDVLSIL